MGCIGVLKRLAILAILPAFAWANPCEYNLLGQLPEISIHRSYRKLIEDYQLLSQTDPRLGARKLLVENGGLCTTTCALNTLHAVAKFQGADTRPFTERPDYWIHRMALKAYQEYETDARMGLAFEQTQGPLIYIARELGLKIEVRTYNRPHKGYFISDLIVPNDTMLMATVHGSTGRFHAINIIQLDLVNNVITYSDPNAPYVEYLGNFRRIKVDGVPGIQMELPAGSYKRDEMSGKIENLMTVKALR